MKSKEMLILAQAALNHAMRCNAREFAIHPIAAMPGQPYDDGSYMHVSVLSTDGGAIRTYSVKIELISEETTRGVGGHFTG